MAEKKECEKSQNIVDEASEKEKKESLNQNPKFRKKQVPRRAVKKARLMRLPDCQPNWKL